jgi:predicted nucleic acid-binding protein
VKYFFLDTSAFVKAYVVEAGERRVRGLVAGAVANPPACRLVVTDFTFLEAISALLQKRSEGKITKAACDSSLAEIETLLKGTASPYLVISTSDVSEDVPSIIRRYSLRPGDAVHVAAALAARHSTPTGMEFVFVTSDANQANAARAEGFDVWDPAVD